MRAQRRRRRSAYAGVAISVVLTALVLSPSAMAHRTGLFSEIDLKGSNGYPVSIVADHWKHSRQRAKVRVTVRKGAGLTSLSTYEAPARLTRHRLKANLGAYGRIALRYHSTGRHPRSAIDALKAPEPGALATTFFQHVLGCAVGLDDANGLFKGRIRFHGEGGYTRIRVNRARGFISPATSSCSKVRSPHGVGLDAGSGSVRFEADRFRGTPQALFVAKENETVGRVAITRMALDGGRKHSFSFASDLSSAHVVGPGGIFRGSADFSSSGGWTGTLTATFPGDSNVALTGPEFTARMGRF